MMQKHPIHRVKSLVVTGIATLILFLSGCQPATECGSWNFTGTPDAAGPDTYGVSDGFTFTPANCGQNCNCTADGIIQMVWVYDSENHTWLESANNEANGPAKATANHWEIDQYDSWGYAYYGLENDGVTFDAGFNNAGSNGVASVLNDDPGGQGNNIFFFALDVAVCHNSQTCQNNILGSYFWSWHSDNSGTVTTFANVTGWTSIEAEFQQAVTVWNTNWVPLSRTLVMNGSLVMADGVSSITLGQAATIPGLTDL
jgi:hypothetical protein